MPLAEPLQQTGRVFVRYRGRKLVYFGGCDYFRLSSHPEVIEALHDGIERFGLNVAASRSTTGNHELYGALEKALAGFFAVDAAALFSNGYVTNFAVAEALAGEVTHVLIDERSHGSPKGAAALIGCPVVPFSHRSIDDLRGRLKVLGRGSRPLVITDGLFSHDGSVAPLAAYLKFLPRQGWLLVDDAHGAGTLGETGKGSLELCGGQRSERVIQTISLSKAFGVYGGAVLATERFISELQERSRIFNGNTPLPLPLAGAALAALKVLRRDKSLRRRLNANIAFAAERLAWPVERVWTPIISVVPRRAQQASALRKALLRAGIFPSCISYAGSEGYFRFALSSEHTPAQIENLLGALRS